MKVARTFTINLSVASELKELKNQSAFVNAAIIARLALRNQKDVTEPLAFYHCDACYGVRRAVTGETWMFCTVTRDCQGEMLESPTSISDQNDQ
mgnify:CR=1 FL=1